MALSVLLLLALIGCSQAIPAPGHGAYVGYCETSSNCAVDECCHSFNQPRGKRTVLTSYDPKFMSLFAGGCQKRGTEGSHCIVNVGLSTGKVGLFYDCPCMSGYTCHGTLEIVLQKGEGGCMVAGGLTTGKTGLYYDCPCMPGFDCQGTGIHEIPKGEIGVCRATGAVPAVSTIGGSCVTGDDCGASECCVSDMQAIGKRKATRRDRSLIGGHCMAMGTSGSNCFAKMTTSGKPSSMVNACPCTAGLTCHGNGLYEVPFGERGTCMALKG